MSTKELHSKKSILHFEKNEIVWAKMKFFSPWPAKVCKSILLVCLQIQRPHIRPKLNKFKWDRALTIFVIFEFKYKYGMYLIIHYIL